MITNSSMISLLVASHTRGACFLALFNLWLDDGGKLANFYDNHGLTLQGNVEFMRNFGLGGKQFSSCRRRRAKTYVLPFDIKSHGSGVHPDLNLSEFSRKVFLGKVVRFLQFQHWGRSKLAPSRRSFNGSPEKKRYWDFSTLWSLRAAAVCLFVKSESFDTSGPHTLGWVGNQLKRVKTLSNLKPSVTFWLSSS